MLMELTPGDVIAFIDTGEMTAEEIQELREYHNLHRSVFYRYGLYMLNLFRGDLGLSDFTRLSVWDLFIDRLPNTLILSFSALIIGVAIAVPMGIIAARRAGKLMDNITTGFTLVGMSMPVFWIGILLLVWFSSQLGWLPGGGNRHGIRSLILPALCSSLTLMASAARQTRSGMLEVLRADFLRTARAKGVPEKVVVRKHALGNAWIPIITALGTSLGMQLAGAVVVESVFNWPGIGRLAAEAVSARDVTTTTGVVVMTTILYVLIHLVVDVLYAFIDPRVKAQYMSNKRRKKQPKSNRNTP
jgi:peptide/nickel transport system permease protein